MVTLQNSAAVDRAPELIPGMQLVWTDGRPDLIPWIQMISRETSRTFVPIEAELRTRAVVDALVDRLAELAYRAWPRWSGLSRTGWADDTRPASAGVFRRILNGTPGISAVWLRRALGRMAEHRWPRVRAVPPALEAEQLMRVVTSPHGLAGLWQPPAEAEPAALGAVMLEIEGFARAAQTPLYVAVPPRMRESPAVQRFAYRALRLDARPSSHARPPSPTGAPHPMSPGEAKVYDALRSDPRLHSFFSFNQTVALPSGVSHRVDGLWRAGRLVYEIDGWQHMVKAHYEADRIRDGQLMADGYVVLRILHTRAVYETRLVVEEIRSVVEARKRQGTGAFYGN